MKIMEKFRRCDVLFLGSLFVMMLLVTITVIFNFKHLANFFHHSNGWLSIIWLTILVIVMLPSSFFPKTKWSKWWNANAFFNIKYYFITYQASNRQGGISIWNEVIATSPMKFIKNTEQENDKGSNTYYNFVILNTCEISKKEFNKYKDNF